MTRGWCIRRVRGMLRECSTLSMQKKQSPTFVARAKYVACLTKNGSTNIASFLLLVMSGLPPPSVLEHVVDVHCHPTDALHIPGESISRLPITICAMSSMESDQQLVRELALANPTRVVPCFG